jgi:hypothetical protein
MSSQLPPKPPAKPPARPPAKPPLSKPAPQPPAGRKVPAVPVSRKPPKASRVIVVGIVIGFIGSAASAIAPLLFRASSWWLALSLVLLMISAVAAMALREPQ